MSASFLFFSFIWFGQLRCGCRCIFVDLQRNLIGHSSNTNRWKKTENKQKSKSTNKYSYKNLNMWLRRTYESCKMLCQQAAYRGRQHCTSKSNDCIALSMIHYSVHSRFFLKIAYESWGQFNVISSEKLVTKSPKLSLFSCKSLSCLGASSHRTRYSTALLFHCFLCKQGRWMCLIMPCQNKRAALKFKGVQLILDTDNAY